MPKWRVTLSGDSWDLESLADLGVGVTREGNAFALRSPELDSFGDAGEVRQRAIKLVEVLNGIARIAVGDFDPVAVGAVHGDDGGGTHSVLLGEDAKVRDRARVRVADAATGTPVAKTPTSGVPASWLSIAARDQNARQALRLIAGAVDPVNLYRIFEVIRADVGGEDQMVTNGWATRSGIRRFRHSVNSVSALGDAARHGVEPGQPPADPMSVPEAAALVRGLLEKWLTSK
jgi:hypothetical protein